MPTDRDIAFPVLDPAEIDALRPRGSVRRTHDGEVLWQAGDRRFPLFVVLSGTIDILQRESDGTTQLVVQHAPGQFTGDVDMLTGRGALIEGRVGTGGEVLAVESAEL